MLGNCLKLALVVRFVTAVIVAATLLAAPGLAETLRGKVVGVTDGDTITLLVDGRRQYKIRLGEIDAPEGGQPYGRKSKRILSDLVYGQTISARVTDIDRYGRAVAVLTRGNTNINAEMVKRGGAWAYRRYLSDQRYLRWEEQARQARRGLWGLQADQIMAPWDWRAARRGGGRTTAQTTMTPLPGSSLGLMSGSPGGSAFQCGTKRVCRQMTSCDEALYHLQTCGVKTLDGDGDGVPCEKICR
ncbi:thermonuclease family protein [Sandarakinorhabdus rubra]|uniref:thermonuclease family protein n=1 Tax=Sandarakinorhabdus rubra TaxID=2672568 RepID=UPI0013DA75C1|nr:thermonuclease family protein [Sandarakinorhabdus rubra]